MRVPRVNDALLEIRRVVAEAAAVVPVAELVAVVGRVAVAGREHTAGAGPENGGFLECGEIPDHPWSDNDHTDRRHHAEDLQLALPWQSGAKNTVDPTNSTKSTTPSERVSTASERHSACAGRAKRGRPPEAVHRHQCEHDEEAVESLDTDDGVVDPQRGKERSDEGGDQTDAIACQLPTEQADAEHDHGAEERGEQAKRELAADPQSGRQREEERVERRVQRGRFSLFENTKANGLMNPCPSARRFA